MTKHKAYENLIQGMGACTTSELSNIMEAAQAIGDEHMLVAACMMICSLAQERHPPAALYEQPLNALCSCKSKLASDALLHIAQHARNARIRVEAIRRLGGVGTKAAREMLYQLAKEGFGAAQGFVNDVIQPDMVRLAAFEALAKSAEPKASDGKAILEAIGQDLSKGDDSGAFRAGAGALAHVARGIHLKDLVGMATECRHPLMALRLLAACSNLDTRALAGEKEAIAACLSKNMHDFREEGELLDKLCALARKITHKEFVLKVSDSHHGDCLDRGRGKIASAALEAYPAKDDTLTEAYLRYARSPDNVQQGSKCIAGLAACAAAGHAAAIAKRIVHQENTGYQQLVRSGSLRIIFADISGVVGALCAALDAIEDAGQRAGAAQGVCDGLIRVSMTAEKNTHGIDRLENIREPNRRQGGVSQLPRLADGLRSLGREDDALTEFASQLCAGSQSTGTVAIARVLLKPFDGLADVFLDRLVTAASHIKMEDPPAGVEDSPLAPIEPFMFPDCRQWFGRELSARVVKDGRLNRYAIDLMRRHDLTFVENADKALQEVEASADAAFILRLLASRADGKCLRLLGRAVEQVFRASKDGVEVRRTALELLGAIASQRPKALDPALTQELLTIVHNRFRADTKIMRLCAYAVCGQFASPASIVPLHDRLKSESDMGAKEAIARALGSIKSELLAAKPSHQGKTEMIVAWLGHVGNLGDQTMTQEALEYLCPPHAEPVLVAALTCLSKIGTRETINAIDRFVEETSPAGEVLKAARLAKAALQGRKDLSFMEALGAVFDPESTVLDPEIHYEKLLGIGRLKVMTACLTGAMEQWVAHHWGDFVERIDGFCDLLNQDLYENRWDRLGLTKEKAQKCLPTPYGGRIYKDEFKKTLPTVQPLFVSLHSMRGLAEGAHPLKPDGTMRPGVSEAQGRLAMDQFKELFAGYIQWLTANGMSTGMA